MKVEVHYKDASRPITYEKVKSTYIKGEFFVVYIDDTVYKHPIQNIWRIREDY
jgi:hypothetical protein